ncbi:MAG TPA: transglycosylase domain-containing protein [Thermoleophilaceae bacterium]|jgi:penicillin-binding protein 1A
MTHRQRKLRRRRSRTGRNGAFLAVLIVLSAILIAGLSGVGYVFAVAASAPDIDGLKPIDKGASSIIYAADGSRLGYVQSDTIRTPVGWSKIPPIVRQATVAIEDERFYRHKGVDVQAVGRAAFEDVVAQRSKQGGSTITQQLVRQLYIERPDRNIQRKIKEAKMAADLEQERSKQWILREYLNVIPYGTVNGKTAIGIQAAAQLFFSRKAQDLTLTQAAMLAGLPQAPSQYNPLRNPTDALERRNRVLEKMAEHGYITQAEATTASSEPLGLKRSTIFDKRREPYFFDYVQDKLIERYGVGVYRRGGLKIHTTIDPRAQEQGRAAINGRLGQPGDPSSAIVAIDPKTGYIRAMASSGTYNDRTFNLAAQGHRQPGSAFKTMVLVTALRKGIDPNSTVYVSKPLQLNVPGYGPWKVKTYDGSYGGAMNLVQATIKSDNTVYAQLDIDVGPKEVAETAHMLGIRTKLDGIPSEGLGGLRLGVSPLEMSSAYATLAAGGMYSEPKAIRRVEFPDGKSDDLGKPKRKRVISDGVAYEVTKILQQNVQRGTGTRAQIGCPAAGKTGTTDNYNDAWFAGYTPSLAAAVWVGYPNALKEMRNVHGIQVAGGTFPTEIWGDFIRGVKRDCRSFPPPKEPARFSTFFGRNSASGRAGGGYRAPTYGGGGGSNSAGGGNYRGYDPRLYTEPPQAPPRTTPPPSGGGNKGGGNGNGGGNDGGGNGGADGGNGGGAGADG